MRTTFSTVVLTHTGSAVPDYTEVCIKQIQHKNPRTTIVLIVDEKHGLNFLNKFKLKNVLICPIRELEDDVLLKKFREVSWFKNWGRPNTSYMSPDNFVHGTSERLFLLNAFACKYNYKDIWHIENDNIIYGSFEWMSEVLKGQDKVSLCYMNEKHVVCNVIHIPCYTLFNQLVYWYLEELKQGNQVLVDKYKIDMVQEMTVLRQYPHVNYFPSLPDEKALAGMYFDPASYGQYLGGTNNGHEPGFLDTVNHDIGRSHNKRWQGAGIGYKQAFVLDMKNVFHRLFNLHIHNKHKMRFFSTYE